MMKSKTKLRHGITITEALASIGVAAVGLFGVLAVIPFAARQAEVGLDLDFAVAAGKNAFHDFEARGMGDRSLWRIGFAETAGTPAADFDPSNENINWSWDGRPVVIDPLFIQNNLNLMINDATDGPRIDHFPLGNFAGGADSDHLMGRTAPATMNRINVASRSSTGPLPYNFAQAINVFQHQDDLSFGEQEDKLLLPPQNYKLIDPAVSNQDVTNRLKRTSSGRISWMAMLIPEADNPSLYRVYIIVFKNRQLEFKRDSDGEIVGERIFNATPLAGGFGGGEFQLTNGTGALLNSSQTAPKERSIHPGDWMLLTDNDINYRWYQVSRINEENAPDLQVSLTGPDWNTNLANTQAIVLSGVVAIFEKTIPVENDSIWNQ